MSKATEEVLLQNIVYIGEEIPLSLIIDHRPKFIVLGTPAEFINEVKRIESEEES